ncbi:hypothetical protein F3Y22_tig00110156pilonHSYRG00525 [Hibiscus syriacus]|uniref:Uncharacterized protein n=1 Tax=Hibiscus syriacus TaxID=106335 RepID=A0A6A3BGC2_HIBSY|nr:hypothetical protein F3Y22_tig00110156pilonHSYRG00525 [Hibiscus syriacus]
MPKLSSPIAINLFCEEMVRLWKQGVRVVDGGATEEFSGAFLMLWAALVALSLVTAILLSCAGGASKDKASATHDTYGSACAAGCGAGCGG